MTRRFLHKLRGLAPVAFGLLAFCAWTMVVALAANAETSSDDSGWAAAREASLIRATSCLETRDPLCLLREAKSATRWVDDSSDREWLNRLRAAVYAERGRLELAREAVAAIQDDVLRAETFGAMAGHAATIGERQEAVDLLIGANASLKDAAADFNRVEALAEIGWGYAKLGDEDRAAKAWREAESLWKQLGAPSERASTLYELAWSEIDGRAIADALPIVEWLDHQVPEPGGPHYQLSMHVEVDAEGKWHATQVPAGEPVARAFAALLYARAGISDKAEAAVDSLEDLVASWESWPGDETLLIALAHAQAALHRFAKALNTVGSIDSPYGRVFSLCLIAHEQRQSADEAVQTLRQALAQANGLSPVEMARVLIGMADALP